MQEVICDERGRIVLPREIREALGQRFVVVPAKGEVILIPVPKDPVKRLAELGKKAGISQTPISTLRKAIAEEAARGVDVRRH